MEGKLRGGISEVRRLHIIYFLSHMGRAEHPHLIRIHHLTRSGVYLRDVKRWLGDLRGKDMPEAYAWSYKRRYKTGYVWQDLLDDDLITPLSDNEYVLKGSEIICSPNDDIAHQYSCDEQEKLANSKKTDKTCIEEEKLQPPDSRIDPPSKIFSEINEEGSSSFGSDRSSLTDELEPVKFEADKHLGTSTQNNSGGQGKPTYEKSDMEPTPTYCRYPPLMEDRKSKTKNHQDGGEKRRGARGFSKSSLPAKAKTFTGGASSVLRNFITCGAVDTNDAVFVTLRSRNQCDSTSTRWSNNATNKYREILKGEGFKTSWDDQQEGNQKPQRHSGSSTRKSHDEKKDWKKQQSKFSKQRAAREPYRPTGEPNCSQCGKAFKPEKLHSHMKSCRGIKVFVNSSICGAFIDKSSVPHHSQQGSTNSIYKDSALGYLLTN